MKHILGAPLYGRLLALPTNLTLSWKGEPLSACALTARPGPHSIRGHTSPQYMTPSTLGPALAISPQCSYVIMSCPHCARSPHRRATSAHTKCGLVGLLPETLPEARLAPNGHRDSLSNLSKPWM